MLTIAEENYLKALFKLTERAEPPGSSISTNALAAEMQTTPASTTDMLKRLHEKQLIAHERYRGVRLTVEGARISTQLIRKHRLWEVFLLEKLGFEWHEVHDLAEQLEHIQGDALVERLDTFLGHPQYDPHGDPIPDAQGQWAERVLMPLSDLAVGATAIVCGVDDHNPIFLQYLQSQGLVLGAAIQVVERYDYDQSTRITIGQQQPTTISYKVTRNLLVNPNTTH
jgi:DtxR family transcriptional regulator, Mn-dependent transcriptional regulator